MMKKITTLILLLVSTGISMQVASQNVNSLRGGDDISQNSTVPDGKKYAKDGDTIARNYVQQPPLIPHKISGYRVNLKSNKCLSCHSWAKYKKAGATKISQTHFESREGELLSSVSSRRYFCTQCHVPQVNAKPLIENQFKPVTTISGK
jgi:cytochrome c-type protein NapB